MLHLILGALLLAQVPMRPVGVPVMGMPPPEQRGSQSGISVTGSAIVHAPASSVWITLHITSRNNAMTLTAASVQPIVDALVSAGIDRSSIVLPMYLQGPAHTNNVEIGGAVAHPSVELLKNGIVKMVAAFSNMPDVALNGAEVRLRADGCENFSRQAEAAALRQARANAGYIAQQLGVHLGAVQAVQSNAPASESGEGCIAGYSFGPYGGSIQMSRTQNYLDVPVYSTVTARYAIKP